MRASGEWLNALALLCIQLVCNIHLSRVDISWEKLLAELTPSNGCPHKQHMSGTTKLLGCSRKGHAIVSALVQKATGPKENIRLIWWTQRAIVGTRSKETRHASNAQQIPATAIFRTTYYYF
ncbi:hypothetical protein GQ54DRAFT_224883 [Martensiomyces pterosporus]|nr:hypothetical protein GQ54DRAFT_224883 [Martensiomyces pterosporus]